MPSSLYPKIEDASASSSSSSCFAAGDPDDHAGSERAEQDVDPELAGDGDEAQHEQQRHPDGQLRAGPEPLGEEGDQPLAPWPARQEGGAEDEEGERGQHEDRLHRVRPREEEPDEHDRPELAHAAERHGIPTERRAQHAGVPQDRQQRSERRRGQGERDDDLVAVPTGHVDAKTDHGGQHDRQAPADARQSERAPTDGVELQLVAGQEHQHGQAEDRQPVDETGRLDQIEHLGAEDDPEQISRTTDGIANRRTVATRSGASTAAAATSVS